jgi:hypothetical protein
MYMKKSELKQLIREVISELSPKTLDAAANLKAKLGRGDLGQRMRDVAKIRRENELDWKKLGKLVGINWEETTSSDTPSLFPYDEKIHKASLTKKRIKELLSLKLKFYEEVGKLVNFEHEYYVIDVDEKQKKLILTNAETSGLELFIGTDENKKTIVRAIILPYSVEIDLAFDHKSRLKVINMFKNIGVNINANNVYKY